MEPYRVGDAVRILRFEELISDPAAIDHGFDGNDGFYGIADYAINRCAEMGFAYIRDVGVFDGKGYDYRLETLDGELLPYHWLHCMLRPANESGDEEIDPGSLEDLFDFLQD